MPELSAYQPKGRTKKKSHLKPQRVGRLLALPGTKQGHHDVDLTPYLKDRKANPIQAIELRYLDTGALTRRCSSRYPEGNMDKH